LTNQPIFNYS